MDKTLAYYITYLYKNFLAFSTKELKKIGISYGQLPFILYIGTHPDCTHAELTRQLHMDWGHSQRSVSKLVDQNFITRSTPDNDSRNNHLSLTDSGRQVFQLSHQVFDSWDGIYLTKLNPEEKLQLFTLFQKLLSSEDES